MNIINRIYIGYIMGSCSDSVDISISYRPGNLQAKPPVKVIVDDGVPFTLSNEGVKILSLTPGMHDIRMRCRFRRKKISVLIDSPTKVTIGFCRDCGKLKARTDTVKSVEDLDFERKGY